MTEENFNYRTNPMFLRNQFDGYGKCNMPLITKNDYSYEELNELRLIGFDKVKNGKDKHYSRMVHFFLYDYKFEDIWKKPDKYVNILKNYRAVLTPDFSMYLEMPIPLKMYNTFRNRWCGAYLVSKGINVIPTVNWGNEDTFDFCFDGIEKGSTVAVSTYMVSEHNNHADQKDFFMKGYNEMLRKIEPQNIICYNTPFPEMQGNIIYVDYELSSWKHLNDEEEYKPSPYVKYICGLEPWPEDCNVIRKSYGYVIPNSWKGMGSAYGGKWIPKKEDDKRFLGKPGSINSTHFNGKKGGYDRDTKIGADGRATIERHYTDHNTPHAHSNPHDHYIIWDENTGAPRVGPPINYPNGAPTFKNWKGNYVMNYKEPTEEYFEEVRFKTISDFKWAINHGAEIEMEWKDKVYYITQPNGVINIHEEDCWMDAKEYKTADEALEFMLGEDRLRDVITKIKVWNRTI